MIWQNPWAWLGLLTLAVPVLIHLLSRHVARVQKFPTLRFLNASRLTPTRRTRLSDPLLLMVRLAILGAAVAALAQPLLLTSARRQRIAHTLARAIIVDSSRSMLRLARSTAGAVSGERAIDVARREAQRLAREANASVVIESNAPGNAVRGALGWLTEQSGTHEVVVLSDFQLGALDEGDLAIIPSEVGVRLMRVDINVNATPMEWATHSGEVETIAHITLAADRTSVEWSVGPLSRGGDGGPLILAGALERTQADAARQAALTMSALSLVDTTRPVAIVYTHADARSELLRDARSIDRPWMADVVARLRGDSTVVRAASGANVEGDTSSTAFTVVARNDSGRTVAFAAHGVVQGRDRLLIFLRADAGSLASAAVIGGVMRATDTGPKVTELEPGVVSDEALKGWEAGVRDSTTRSFGRYAPSRMTGDSDGRWFWVLALVLIALETFIRRAPREALATETPA